MLSQKSIINFLRDVIPMVSIGDIAPENPLTIDAIEDKNRGKILLYVTHNITQDKEGNLIVECLQSNY